jgi:uncharacterized protein involved in exopolysaccharide biosynthesis
MSDNSNSNDQLARANQIDDDEISLLDLLQIIVENLRLLVFGPIICGLIVLCITFTIDPSFKAKTQFLTPQQQQNAAANILASLGPISGFAGAVSGLKSPSDQYISFLKSYSLQDSLIERFQLSEKFNVKHKADARAVLDGKVKIASGKDGLIIVEVDDKDPKFAADLANAHVIELEKLLTRLAVTEAQQRRMYFEKQIDKTKESFTKAYIALKGSGIGSAILKLSPSSALESVARLKAGIVTQEIKLSSMRNYVTDNSPEFKLAMNELNSLKTQLFKAENDEPIYATNGDYLVRYREYKYQESMLEFNTKQFELAKLDESKESSLIQILDMAEPPNRKSWPNKTQITIVATFLSEILLLVFVFVRNFLKSTSQNFETQQRLNALKSSWKKTLGK